MAIEFVKQMPQPQEIKERYPLSYAHVQLKEKRDIEIKKIFSGEDKRLMLIIGPCSADNEDSVLDYTTRLAGLQEKVKDKILMIPRVYTNKPRTTGEGYMGMVHQPDPTKEEDMLEGLIAVRRLHTRVIEETGFTSADEMLYPENYQYLSDLLSYVAVGARSVENQQHRLTASAMDVPVGMKNPTAGDYSVMLNSIYAAQHPHVFLYRGWQVKTSGNPYVHAILRGFVNKHGEAIPNYHYEDISLLHELYCKRGLENMGVIIDANHSNSNKKYLEQVRICKEVLHSRRMSSDINSFVKGLMVESYIEDGNQGVDGGVYGKSITDACIGWDKTERFVLDIADTL